MSDKILIYGAKDFAFTVKQLIIDCGYEPVGMIDDFESGDGIVGTFEEVSKNYSPEEYSIAMAIGYLNLPVRWKIFEKVVGRGYSLPKLIHPRAYVSNTASIAQGAMIMAGAIVDVNAKVEEIGVLWPGVVLNHDSVVGANTFVSPNATICGFTTVGSHTFIGAGSVIADHRQVPDNSFVKANSLFK